ncbi:uncharacterized protein IWZ02DRAFT_156513 [Phyllosticta citriasiana]|uniref:Chromo domain-containing protein n=1 Tax=Phyllosticta citriasiana TaxID=595635 RepID=A0ABR1KBN2_9PEZI
MGSGPANSSRLHPKRKRKRIEYDPDPGREWPALRIVAEHKDQYKIEWKGDWLPTWEPKANASEALVADWVRQKTQGRRPGHFGYYAAKRIIGERGRKYLIDWCPDDFTGEEYAPSWVGKSAATADLVTEWKDLQRTRPADSANDAHATAPNEKSSPPSSRQPSPPPSARLALEQQLQQDAAESEKNTPVRSEDRETLRQTVEPTALQKLLQLRKQKRPGSTSAAATREGKADCRRPWEDNDGMPSLTAKSVYGVKKRLFQ